MKYMLLLLLLLIQKYLQNHTSPLINIMLTEGFMWFRIDPVQSHKSPCQRYVHFMSVGGLFFVDYIYSMYPSHEITIRVCTFYKWNTCCCCCWWYKNIFKITQVPSSTFSVCSFYVGWEFVFCRLYLFNVPISWNNNTCMYVLQMKYMLLLLLLIQKISRKKSHKSPYQHYVNGGVYVISRGPSWILWWSLRGEDQPCDDEVIFIRFVVNIQGFHPIYPPTPGTNTFIMELDVMLQTIYRLFFMNCYRIC